MRVVSRISVLLMLIVLMPTVVAAQAVIAGTVKDPSGAVLPGVTVEAASPALIEKVRTAVTDGTGQYRVEDLRPGTYSVTFTLQGFNTLQAGRHRADRLVHRHRQRRSQGRVPRGDDHGHRRVAGRGHPERQARSDLEQRRPQSHSDRSQLRRDGLDRARRQHQSERRRRRPRPPRSFRSTAGATTRAA